MVFRGFKKSFRRQPFKNRVTDDFKIGAAITGSVCDVPMVISSAYPMNLTGKLKESLIKQSTSRFHRNGERTPPLGYPRWFDVWCPIDQKSRFPVR